MLRSGVTESPIIFNNIKNVRLLCHFVLVIGSSCKYCTQWRRGYCKEGRENILSKDSITQVN